MEFKPHAYQQHCINKIIEIKKLGLFLDMGLGKTVTTLTAVKELKYNRFLVRRVLVIAPKKVAEGTWTREAAKWGHTQMLRVSPVLGSQTKRIRALNTPADLYIINRENVCWLVDYYRNAWPFDMVVVDESSSFKSHSAKRFKALASVGDRIDRMVELTGTPSPNDLRTCGARSSCWMGENVWESGIPSLGRGISSRIREGRTAWCTAMRPSRERKQASWKRSPISVSA